MKRLLFILTFTVLTSVASAQVTIPEFWGHAIHDEAGILTPSAVDSLEAEIQKFHDSTSNQIAVWIIQSLKGENAELLAYQAATQWKLGYKGKDNGILLFIAVDDHQIRIEVGKGLEGVLPDAICGRIIRNEMAPAFRQSSYDLGVRKAIAGIMAATRNEYNSSEEVNLNSSERVTILLILYAILGIFFWTGLAADPIFTWIIYVFLMPFFLMVPYIPALDFSFGIWIFWLHVVLFPILRKFLPERFKESFSSKGNRGWSTSGGWGSSFGSGSSSSSSSSSSSWSSGFSGGGGSFGGGGASGSW